MDQAIEDCVREDRLGEDLWTQLLAYCKHDALAMVEVWREFGLAAKVRTYPPPRSLNPSGSVLPIFESQESVCSYGVSPPVFSKATASWYHCESG